MCDAVLIRGAEELSFEYADLIAGEIAPALIFAFGDAFSETKRAAAITLCRICRVAPHQVCTRTSDFTKCLIASLVHQHVRITAVLDIERQGYTVFIDLRLKSVLQRLGP